MNEELQKQLAEMLKALLVSVQNGATWAGGQIPVLVQEKIAFGRMSEPLAMLAFAVVSGVLLRMSWGCWTRHMATNDRYSSDWIAGVVIFGLAGGAAMALASTNAYGSLMVWFAPRLYIVEWLKGMVQ